MAADCFRLSRPSSTEPRIATTHLPRPAAMRGCTPPTRRCSAREVGPPRAAGVSIRPARSPACCICSPASVRSRTQRPVHPRGLFLARGAPRHAPLQQQTAPWAAVGTKYVKELAASPDELKTKSIRREFVDVHAAFANARLRKPEKLTGNDRAFVHLRYARELLPLTGMTPDQQTALLAPAVRRKSPRCKRPATDRRRQLARRLLELDPEEVAHQDRLATAIFRGLRRNTQHRWRRQGAHGSERRPSGGRRLAQVQVKHPVNTLVFELIGPAPVPALDPAREWRPALRGAAGHDKARLFAPSLEAAKTAMDQLIENMKALQAKMAEMEAQLRQSEERHLECRRPADAQRSAQRLHAAGNLHELQ